MIKLLIVIISFISLVTELNGMKQQRFKKSTTVDIKRRDGTFPLLTIPTIDDTSSKKPFAELNEQYTVVTHLIKRLDINDSADQYCIGLHLHLLELLTQKPQEQFGDHIFLKNSNDLLSQHQALLKRARKMQQRIPVKFHLAVFELLNGKLDPNNEDDLFALLINLQALTVITHKTKSPTNENEEATIVASELAITKQADFLAEKINEQVSNSTSLALRTLRPDDEYLLFSQANIQLNKAKIWVGKLVEMGYPNAQQQQQYLDQIDLNLNKFMSSSPRTQSIMSATANYEKALEYYTQAKELQRTNNIGNNDTFISDKVLELVENAEHSCEQAGTSCNLIYHDEKELPEIARNILTLSQEIKILIGILKKIKAQDLADLLECALLRKNIAEKEKWELVTPRVRSDKKK